jgi:hypothetical protein
MAYELDTTETLIVIRISESWVNRTHILLINRIIGLTHDDENTLIIYLDTGQTIEIDCEKPQTLAVQILSALGWS